MSAKPVQPVDRLAWARVIVAEFQQAGGRKRSPTVVRMAHEALRLPVPKGSQA